MKHKKTGKKIFKRFISIILVLTMVFMIPNDSYAYIGAVLPSDSNLKTGTFTQNGVKYAYIQNDYIHFDLCIDNAKPELVGQYSRTFPRATMQSDFKKLPTDSYQMNKLQIAAPKIQKIDGYNEVVPNTFVNLPIKSVTYKFDGAESIPLCVEDNDYATEEYDLAVSYTTEHTDVEITTYYKLVKLNSGSTDEGYFGTHHINYSDTTVNWGVRSNTVCRWIAKKYFSQDDEIDGNNAYKNTVFFRTDQTLYSLPIMGHEDLKSSMKDINMSAQTLVNGHDLKVANITNGISKTAPNTVMEVFSDSYSFAAPFVAGSNNYYLSGLGGVEGHKNYYAESMTYAGNNLNTSGQPGQSYAEHIVFDDVQSDIHEDKVMYRIASSTSLWGFRNLATMEEVEEEQIEPDKVSIRGDAPYLCVFPDGNKTDSQGNQIYKVLPAGDQNEIKSLETANGKSVAQYRGNYLVEDDKGVTSYKFIDGAVALSPSITATWDTVDGSYIRLKNDGKLDFSNTISLNTPTFKFYEPKVGGGITFDGYDAAEGIKLKIDPKKNKAVVNISLPGNSVQLKEARIDTKGNLLFSGKFKLNLFVAQLDMQKLGYGLNSKSQFVCNGVVAEGMLKVPKIGGHGGDDDDDKEEEAKPNVLGFGGAKMEGKIDTFKGYYDFKFELTIKNLFSTKAELTLVKLKNGRLCPEHLWFELKSEVEGAGIDLAPAAPAVTITGGGGGIDGLASTIDGNYVAIPPVVLTLTTYGQVVKVVDGQLTAKIGPSQLRLIGENVGLKVGDSKLKVIDKMSAGVYLTGKEITYGTDTIPKMTYRGVTFGGDIGIGIKIFNFKDDDPDPLSKALKFFNNTISAEAGLGLETYVGNAVENPKWCYVYVGTYGKASCSLNIPAGVPGIGGKSLLGAGLDFKLGAQTAFETGQGGSSVKAFFKNIKVTGGIAASGHVWPVYGRVIYIIPDKVKFEGKLFKDVDELDWDEILEEKSAKLKTNARTTLLSEPAVVDMEDGEQAVVLTEANIAPVTTFTSEPKLLAGGSYSQTVMVKTASVADDENVILAIEPKNAEDIDALRNSVSTTAISSLNWMPDQIVEGDTDPGYNAWVSTFDTDEDGNPIKQAVFLSIPKSRVVELGNRITVNAGVEFDTHGLATTPITELQGVLAGNSIQTTIANPDPSQEYVQYTYFGSKVKDEDGNEQITTDYLVDSHEISDPSQAQTISLNESGNLAPTGDYYVTSTIVHKTKMTVTNEEGEDEEVDTEIPVSSWVSGASYSYTNTEVVAAPASAGLHCIGNEAMQGSFTASANADGYKVTIYQQNENGEWVDTERGYSFTKDEFENVPGLSFDNASNTYTIDLAMTVGGDGEATTIEGEEGEDVEISAEAAQEVKALEAGKTYRLGVSAFKSKTMEVDGEESSYDEYSDEILSQAKYLPKYRQVTFDITNYGDKLERDENGVYTLVTCENPAVKVENIKFDGMDVSENTTVSVTRVGELDENGEEVRTPIEVDFADQFNVSEITGNAQLEVSVMYEHEGVKDETIAYVTVTKDTIAPVITLDEDIVTVGEDGSYAINGVTESKSSVYDIFTGIEVMSDSDGRFSFTGIETEEVPKVVLLRAKDEFGNESDEVSVMLTKAVTEEDIEPGPDDPAVNFDATPTPTTPPTQSPTPTPTAPAGSTPTSTPTSSPESTVTPDVTAKPDTTPEPDATAEPTKDPGTEPTKEPDSTDVVTPTASPQNNSQGNNPGDSNNGAGQNQTETVIKVSSIKLDAPSGKIAKGVKVKLKPEINPDNATDKTLVWSSSNDKAASVDQNGIVKVGKKAKGSVTITAMANDGSGTKAQWKFKVVKGIVKSISISGESSVKAGKTLKLKATVNATKGANKKLQWISSNPALATVSSSGVVKAKKTAGKKTVRIIAMATDGTGKKKKIKIKIK